MDLTRRSLFRAVSALGGIAALGGVTGLASEAVAGIVPKSHTTAQAIIKRGKKGKGGFRPLVKAAGEPHRVRSSLGVAAQKGRAKRRTPVLVFAQLSDVHIVDAQSPARLEGGELASSSAYRPHEVLTAHVAESMVRQLNRVKGPVTGLAPQLAIETGDNSDNGQLNEIRWNIDLLDGGTVTPDSGTTDKYEGVMDDVVYNPSFWHPAGAPAGQPTDIYRKKYGFPKAPTLLDDCRQPFEAHGLNFPWLAVFGNHDQLVQGNFQRTGGATLSPTGDKKRVTDASGNLITRTITPDPDRRFLTRAEWMAEHLTTTGLPVGHGFTEDNVDADQGYYTYDQGDIRFIILDTVHDKSEHGSLNTTQFEWLQARLAEATDKAVIVCSHHTSWSMHIQPQDVVPGAETYVEGPAVVEELLAHPNVIAWVNGHTHRNRVMPHTSDSGGFWEINTASHIDWPQQSRLIEVLNNNDGTLSIFCTMVDHRAPLVNAQDQTMKLASLGRLLSANDPGFATDTGKFEDEGRRGKAWDRNVELLVAAPAFMTAD